MQARAIPGPSRGTPTASARANGTPPANGSGTFNFSASSLPRSSGRSIGSQIASASTTASHSPYASTSAPYEWSSFGCDLPISGVRELYADLATPAPAPSNRSVSVLSNADVFSHSFAGNRWKVELVKTPPGRQPLRGPSEQTSEPAVEPVARQPTLSLFLSSIIFESDYPASDVEIPTHVFVAVREPREAGSTRTSNSGWVWRNWADHVFSSDRDFYRIEFPSLDELLANQRVAMTDSLVLSVQVQSQQALPPQFNGINWVPQSLLTGVEKLLDDPATSDVRIFVFERQSPTEDEDAVPMIRKRMLYAHSPLLRARSAYFADALAGGWAESSGVSQSELVLKLDEEFSTVFALLRWIYTNEGALFDPRSSLTHAVDFADDEDIVPWDDVPTLSGRLSSLSWQWTPMPADPVTTASVAVQSSPSHASGRRSVSDGSADARSVTRSPTQALAYAPSPSRPHAKQSSEKLAAPKDADPHAHPTQSSSPASALAVYRLAHRYQLFDLANRALSHIVTTLSPRTAPSLLLATPLWADLHGAIKGYVVEHWADVVREQGFKRSLEEVAVGRWPGAGEVLFDLMQGMTPA